MRKLLLGMFVLGLPFAFACPRVVFAKKPVDNTRSPETKQVDEGETHAAAAYLGIAVESLHPALVTHLLDALINGQGVLVGQVAADSPAAKAGIKAHDILVAYQDQKLFSPEQLVKLVRADEPGQKVELQVVREGTLKSYTVTLGERPSRSETSHPVPAPWWQWHPPLLRQLPKYIMPGERPPWKRKENEHDASSRWKSFDSLTLKKLDDNRYRAEIDYLDKDGQKEHQRFEGTREEIRSQIQAEKNLPANEREHLLRSLNLQSQPVMPDFWYGPRWNWEFDVMPYPRYDGPDVSREF